MSQWESRYSVAVAELASPSTLDEKILQHAKAFKPAKTKKRWYPTAIGSFAALVAAGILLQPFQYLGARTPPSMQASVNAGDFKASVNTSAAPIPMGPGKWRWIRSDIRSGDYQSLCAQWRRQNHGGQEKFPEDLKTLARRHCRML